MRLRIWMRMEAKLIQALIMRNPEMRIIAVGDDDQNIFSFRGSDSKYMKELLEKKTLLYQLIIIIEVSLISTNV